MKPSFSRVFIYCLVGVVIAVMQGLFTWQVIRSVRERLEFKPYPGPYQATVVAFYERRERKGTSYAPIVEVVRSDTEKFRFSSSHYHALNPFSVGEQVKLVSRPYRKLWGKQGEEFEINSAWHLWLSDVLIALLYPGIFLCVFIVRRFVRAKDEIHTRRKRQAQYGRWR